MDSLELQRELENGFVILESGRPTPCQLTDQVAMTTKRWELMLSQLKEQREKLEELRNALASSNDINRKMDRAKEMVSLEMERTRHRNELRNLHQRQMEASEAERAGFLVQFQQLELQVKKLARQGEISKRQTEAAEGELSKLTTELAKERAAGQLAGGRVRLLEAELSIAMDRIAQAEAEKAELVRKLGELKDTVSKESVEKFNAMALRHLGLLEEQESLRQQLQESRLTRSGDWNFVTAVQQPEPQAHPEQVSESQQLHELQQEVIRLRQRESELTLRCEECSLLVSEVISDAELGRSRLQAELTELRSRQQEALQDYADKMKAKAEAEFSLRSTIDELTGQLKEAKRHSAPSADRKH